MNLPTTPTDIEHLLERLYEEKRQLQSCGVANPTFVFFVRPTERYEVERRILAYLMKFWLIDEKAMKITYGGATNKASHFHFPGSDAAIVLMEY